MLSLPRVPSPIDCFSAANIDILLSLTSALAGARKEHNLSPSSQHKVRRHPASERDFLRGWTPRIPPKPPSTQKVHTTHRGATHTRHLVAVILSLFNLAGDHCSRLNEGIASPSFSHLTPSGSRLAHRFATNRRSGSSIDSSVSVSRTHSFSRHFSNRSYSRYQPSS